MWDSTPTSDENGDLTIRLTTIGLFSEETAVLAHTMEHENACAGSQSGAAGRRIVIRRKHCSRAIFEEDAGANARHEHENATAELRITNYELRITNYDS
jgi:hypothetical protein